MTTSSNNTGRTFCQNSNKGFSNALFFSKIDFALRVSYNGYYLSLPS
jgi:hypothetical protein